MHAWVSDHIIVCKANQVGTWMRRPMEDSGYTVG